jgi:hypothetical protein
MTNTLLNVRRKGAEGNKEDNEEKRKRRRVCYKITETLAVLRTSQY